MIPFAPPTLPLKLGVIYQTYNQTGAVFESLRSFRRHFPAVPIRLLSDNGVDVSAIAKYFAAEYIHYSNDLLTHVAPYPFQSPSHGIQQLRRMADAARAFVGCEWLLILEDDVFTRGPIKHAPQAPLSGPCTCAFSPALVQYIRQKHPHLQWVYGYSGCGGTILHIPSFLDAVDWPDDELFKSIEAGGALDSRIPRFGDALLSYVFLNAGYSNGPPWLDQSETSQGRGCPDAAFDHQFKIFYGRPMPKFLAPSTLSSPGSTEEKSP